MLKAPKTAPRPDKERGEAAEEAVSTAYVRARTFVEEYRTVLIATGIGIAVIFLATLGYFYWQHGQGQQANEHLGAILPVYEAGEFERALQGTDGLLGLEAIADEYRRSAAGNLAAFYAGHAHFQLGQYDQADGFFERYRGDELLEASALAGRAAAAEERGDHRRAARLFEEGARTYRTAGSAPDHLLSAARNHEAAGDLDAARRAYETIEELYPDAPAAASVAVYIARLDAMAAAQ